MDRNDRDKKHQQGSDQNKDASTKVMDEKKESEKSQHDREADKIGNFNE